MSTIPAVTREPRLPSDEDLLEIRGTGHDG